MADNKFIKLLLHKYKAFHTFYNKKWDDYYHKKGITPTIIDYDFDSEHSYDIEEVQRKINDYWTHHLILFGPLLLVIIVGIIAGLLTTL